MKRGLELLAFMTIPLTLNSCAVARPPPPVMLGNKFHNQSYNSHFKRRYIEESEKEGSESLIKRWGYASTEPEFRRVAIDSLIQDPANSYWYYLGYFIARGEIVFNESEEDKYKKAVLIYPEDMQQAACNYAKKMKIQKGIFSSLYGQNQEIQRIKTFLMVGHTTCAEEYAKSVSDPFEAKNLIYEIEGYELFCRALKIYIEEDENVAEDYLRTNSTNIPEERAARRWFRDFRLAEERYKQEQEKRIKAKIRNIWIKTMQKSNPEQTFISK